MQIIMYMNMFELAYSIAFRQLLYKPLANDDKEKVKAIYNGSIKIFRGTGMVLLILIPIVSFFVPEFTVVNLPNFFVSILFVILALPFALSYFLMGPNFVIIADQKEYKIGIWIQSISIMRMILMIVVILLKLPFVYIFLIEGLQVFVANLIARIVALKNYPWLKEKSEEMDHSFAKNAKYTVAHRLAYIAINNSDNIIINAFLGLRSVSIFGVYNYLIDAIIRIINSVITAPINSFGNLFNDKERNPLLIFNEFYSFATYIASVISVCIYVFVNHFVLIWIGKEDYILSQSVAAFLALNVFYLTQREPLVISRDTNGLFKESRNLAYIMAIVKILLSVLLVTNYGVAGILFATLFSNWVVDYSYTPRLVFKEVFKSNVLKFYAKSLQALALACGLAFISSHLFNYFEPFYTVSVINFLITAVIVGGFTAITLFIIYFISYKSFRDIVSRGKSLIFRGGA